VVKKTGRKNTAMTDKNTLYLIDGSAYIHRAYHAVRGLSTRSGFPTNAAFGFTNMLLKLIRERAPEYMAVLFDAKGPTFRHEVYPEYKANRPPMPEDLAEQIPYVKQITRAYRVPMLEVPGFEADDLIAALAKAAENMGYHVVMVTGDKDFMQLVDHHILMYDPMKDQTSDVSAVTDKLGIAPGQVTDYMALTGDSSDNVPGVPGIGPKTAADLIRRFGTLEALYEKLDDISAKKQKENLKAHRADAFLSRDLVTLRTDAPLPFAPDEIPTKLRLEPPDNEKLEAIFRELEFTQLLESVTDSSNANENDYHMITGEKELSALIERLQGADFFAVDTETTSLNTIEARLVGISIALKENEAFYIPLAHDGPDRPRQLPYDDTLSRLKPILEDPSIEKIVQNLKYDAAVFLNCGIEIKGPVFDTMIASYLLDPAKRAHSLDRIALDYLRHKTIPYEAVAGKGKSAVPFNRVPLESAVPYACEDADVTLKAAGILRPRLVQAGLEDLMKTVEIPLTPVLMHMERRGVRVDKSRLADLSKNFATELDRLESEIHALAGEVFNVKSAQQLGVILFEKLGLPTKKKTKKKTGYSTDVEVLTELAAVHELPAVVLRHRSLAKLKSTYADALLELVNPHTGRVHTSYHQTATSTGRLSSSDPNLQNIPIRDEEGRRIRSAFIPDDGCVLVSADYSQMELRILAHLAGDDILIESFRNDEDIHTRTAAEVFQAAPEMITGELRRQAKAINFGIIYGMSAHGLSRELAVSRKMAQIYIDHYFDRYKGVKAYIDQTIREACRTRAVTTLLGRIRPLPDIDAKNPQARQFAERIAVNAPIQGTAADFIKLAMIRCDRALREKCPAAGMILTVHDELVFETPAAELETVTEVVRECMEGVWALKVPLKVNIAWGKNWTEAH
jgi:DNA polymerase-1